MKDNFYPVDNEILKNSLDGAEIIDYKKYPNLLNILFNHWVMKKENYTRLENHLNRGEFELSIRVVAKDFGITNYRAEKLIKEFIKYDLIKPIKKGSDKDNKSIYFNCIFSDSSSDSKQTVVQTVKRSNINDLEVSKQTVVQTVVQTVNQNSKKELIKRINKKEINSASSEALWKLYPNKKNKSRAMKDIPKLISKYGYEQIETCIQRYIKYVESERNNGFSSLKFQGGDRFFGSTYVDYLDENYQEQSKGQQSQGMQEFKIDRSIKADSVEDAIKLIRGDANGR